MSISQSLSDRLQSKTVRQSIITNIAKDFNLTRILAEAYFNQISDYFLRHAELTLSTGQLQYLAVEENEPPGKPIALCRKVPVRLTLHNADEDLAVYKKSGLRGLREHKITRVTNEAIDQGGVLSYEDIAFALTCSVVTIKRDMSRLRKRGSILPSRGWRQQMGRGQSHKTQILDLYFRGFQFTEIERKTRHSETAIKRYLQDFARVALLHLKRFSLDEIRISTGFSHRLIGEYLALYKQHAQRPALQRLLHTSKKRRSVSL
ncbi:MAG: DUF1670 domain-containing protein [Bacteroidetes bacterium]|nr:DUF1670 domain-containing protein [Bacteroidota bacterium]MCW5895997.1 DUF1670 domain-containing protein [Bacteroidota bacterium]MCW5896642.1 DUF1670 domain-containing protein [Bacteroidota bacterium]